MKKLLISACLIGENCRYDGKSIKCSAVEELRKYYDLVPFCPEVEGGMSVPRSPSEIHNGRVMQKGFVDVTNSFERGAQKALKLCRFLGIELAVLKEGSPSCGSTEIHNGRFDGGLIEGQGWTTRLLRANGIQVVSENGIIDLIEAEKKQEKAREEKKAALAEKKAAAAESAKKREEKDKKPSFSKRDESRPHHHFGHSPKSSFGKDRPAKKGKFSSHGSKFPRRARKSQLEKDVKSE